MKHKPVLLTLLALVTATAALLLLHRPPPIPAPVVLHPTEQQAAQVRHHMEALQEELQPEEPPQKSARPVRKKAPSPALPKIRTLRLSEEDLNVYLAGDQAARKMLAARGVKTVQILLSEPANLTIRAAVTIKDHAQNVQLDGGLAPDPKLGLRYTATHAQVGRFPLLPAVVTAQANTLAAGIAGQMHGHLPLLIQSVQVQGKVLVLTGTLVKRSRTNMPAPQPPLPTLPLDRHRL